MTSEIIKEKKPELIDFLLTNYEFKKKDGIYSFSAERLDTKELVQIRALQDPINYFNWKLGNSYSLPVIKHSQLLNIYMLGSNKYSHHVKQLGVTEETFNLVAAGIA